MKKHIRLFSAFSFLLVLSAPVYTLAANGFEEANRKRTINKSYKVTADDKLEIENSFGNVSISTWDKNEITVDIEIGTRASTDEKAQSMMDGIDVKDWQEGHTIGFKTKVGEVHSENSNNSRRRDDSRSFYIDYVIHMPAGNKLD